MKKHHIALLAVIAFGSGIPAQADPPPWAPAHGKRAKQVREYDYVYYPAQQVYYSPQEQIWFWMSGDDWRFGVNLPAQYYVQTSGGVSVTLGSPRPYVEHVYVEEQYGRPWRAKNKHKEKHHKHKDHDD